MKNIIPLIVVSIVTVIFFVGYGFLYSGVSRSIEQIQVATEDAQMLMRQDATATSIRTFLDDVTEERSRLDNFVIGENDVVSVIETLERLAVEEGVAINISEVLIASADWKHHERVDVAFSLEGRFENIIGFIAVLEKLPQATRIDQSILEDAGARAWFGSFTARFIKAKPLE
ncbi:MAG: hypothetical protein ACJKTH_00710 [Patescibacteria group bacterium UBA2163]